MQWRQRSRACWRTGDRISWDLPAGSELLDPYRNKAAVGFGRVQAGKMGGGWSLAAPHWRWGVPRRTLAVIPFTSVMAPDSRLPSPDSRLIETEIGSPPVDRTPVSQQGLPEDLLREAAHRLGIVCLILAGLWAANFAVVHFVHPLHDMLSVAQ